jgi:hypothetical protein
MSSLELDPEAVALVRRGWRWRDKVSTVFLAFTAVFVGNDIASVITLVAGGGGAKAISADTAIATGFVGVVVLLVLLYRWLDWEWGKAAVQLVATYSAPLLEILLALLLCAAINQGWDYGTSSNVVANSIVIAAIALVDLAFTLVVNRRIYTTAVQVHLAAWARILVQPDAEDVVNTWMLREQLRTKIYPTLSLFSMNITEPPTQPPQQHHPLLIAPTGARIIRTRVRK